MRPSPKRGAFPAAFIVVGLAGAAAASAAVEPPAVGKGPWLRVTTPRFTLFGEVPEPRLRLVAARLETFRGALEWLHPGSRSSPRETSLYVFKDAKSGLPFTPAPVAGGLLLDVPQPYDVPNYVTVAAPADDPPLDVLYRSYAHQFLEDNFPRLPLTVRAGLVEFYSGFAMTGEGTLIGQVNPEHVRWLRDNAALPLAQQIAVDERSALLATANGRKTFVAGSWALLHYLAAGSGERRVHLPEFLQALESGVPPADAGPAALGLSLDALQQEVAGYVRGNRFPAIRVGGGPGVAPDAGEIVVRTMSADEVLAALGDVLAHAGPDRLDVAEGYHREALRLNPRQARAYAGLGYLRYSRERFDEAVPLLEKAIEIDPDAMSCYLLARSILKVNAAAGAAPAGPAAGGATPPWRARARDLLARAILLRPLFAAPYVTLGATHTLPDGDVATGIALLEKARAMLPARTDIAGNLVYLYLRQGDPGRAQGMMDGALVHGGDPAALASARAAIAAFKENAAARQTIPQAAANPEQQARGEAFGRQEARRLRAEIESTTDPEARAKLEKALKAIEHPPVADYNRSVEIFNEAVDRANKRDYPGAIALLEGLLPKVEDPDFKTKIETLLDRLRKDAARLQSVQ